MSPMESVQRTEPENVLRQFKEETVSSIDHKEMTRHQVMLLLARKHDILASALEDEKNVLDALVKKYRPLLDRALSERDRCNALVRELKEKRRQLYVEIRVLREQFFSLLEKAEELEGAADRARKLKKEVEAHRNGCHNPSAGEGFHRPDKAKDGNRKQGKR